MSQKTIFDDVRENERERERGEKEREERKRERRERERDRCIKADIRNSKVQRQAKKIDKD